MTPSCAELIAALAKELWSAVLCGTSAPEGAERFNRMSEPVLGDVVFVNHTRPGVDPSWLVGRYDSCWSHIGTWDAEEGWSGHCSEVYVIELLDGGYARWENVTLLVLPPTLTEHLAGWHREWMAAVTPGGTS